jgi:hypothetical protein
MPMTVTSWHGCGVRTSSCGWSAISSPEPLPGSHARPVRSRPGLRVHERAPGGVSGRRDGTRARRVGGWLSCVAAPTGVCSCRRRRRAAKADPDDPWSGCPNCTNMATQRDLLKAPSLPGLCRQCHQRPTKRAFWLRFRSASMQVRTRLSPGGRWIRTLAKNPTQGKLRLSGPRHQDNSTPNRGEIVSKKRPAVDSEPGS